MHMWLDFGGTLKRTKIHFIFIIGYYGYMHSLSLFIQVKTCQVCFTRWLIMACVKHMYKFWNSQEALIISTSWCARTCWHLFCPIAWSRPGQCCYQYFAKLKLGQLILLKQSPSVRPHMLFTRGLPKILFNTYNVMWYYCITQLCLLLAGICICWQKHNNCEFGYFNFPCSYFTIAYM